MIPHFIRANLTHSSTDDLNNNPTPNTTTTSRTKTTSRRTKHPPQKLKKTDRPTTVLGSYRIHRLRVTITVRHPWHHVRMVLRLLPDGCEGARGRFWAMEFEGHRSSTSGNFDGCCSRDLVAYEVPTVPFRFLRDRRL